MSNEQIKEYGHVCDVCSPFLPGSLGRQLCDNNRIELREAVQMSTAQIVVSNQALLIDMTARLNDIEKALAKVTYILGMTYPELDNESKV